MQFDDFFFLFLDELSCLKVDVKEEKIRNKTKERKWESIAQIHCIDHFDHLVFHIKVDVGSVASS